MSAVVLVHLQNTAKAFLRMSEMSKYWLFAVGTVFAAWRTPEWFPDGDAWILLLKSVQSSLDEKKKAFELTLHACAEDEQQLSKNSSILCILDVSGLEEKE